MKPIAQYFYERIKDFEAHGGDMKDLKGRKSQNANRRIEIESQIKKLSEEKTKIDKSLARLEKQMATAVNTIKELQEELIRLAEEN